LLGLDVLLGFPVLLGFEVFPGSEGLEVLDADAYEEPRSGSVKKLAAAPTPPAAEGSTGGAATVDGVCR
jgi:hypothetical protein